jgi:hypothetical protein
MVLMLRSQGIAARLVTGFLGGEASALEDYFIVRQSNAHAWVEAYIPGVGWRVYEPTPPVGRPSAGSDSMWQRALQAYDYLIFRWDRYILTFGASDQAGLLGYTRELWERLESWLFDDDAETDALDPGPALESTPEALQQPAPYSGLGGARLVLSIVLLMSLVLGWWLWRRRGAFDATRAYRLLRRRAKRRGLELPGSLGPEAVAHSVMNAWPQAASQIEPIVAAYLEESFGQRRLAPGELAQVRSHLKEARTRMNRAA